MVTVSSLSKVSLHSGTLWLNAKRFVSSNTFLLLTLSWFMFQALYMALSTTRGIGPDETYHIQLIRLFSEHGFSPILNNQNGYFFLGEVVRTPFMLYHYLLSFPFRIFGDTDTTLFLLRAINVAFGTVSLWFVHKIAKQLRLSSFISNLSIFMMANTLMFVFLSSVVNYDNLFTLIALWSVYLLLLLSRKVTLVNTMLLATSVAIGVLIKINYLPIAVLAIICASYFIWQEWHTELLSRKTIFDEFKKHRKQIILLCVPLLLVSLFGLYKYSYNVIEYHTYEPKCDKVLTVSQCEKNSIYLRNKILNSDAPPKINISTSNYVGQWTSIMRDRIFGILGHKSMAPSRFIATWSQVLLLVGLVAFIRKFRANNKQINVTVTTITFYILVLAYDRYRGYHKSGLIDLAVQGRYLFAVLPLMFLLFNEYIFKLFRDARVKLVFTIVTLFVFATASLPSYLIASNPSWYTSPTKRINTKLNHVLNSMNNLF